MNDYALSGERAVLGYTLLSRKSDRYQNDYPEAISVANKFEISREFPRWRKRLRRVERTVNLLVGQASLQSREPLTPRYEIFVRRQYFKLIKHPRY